MTTAELTVVGASRKLVLTGGGAPSDSCGPELGLEVSLITSASHDWGCFSSNLFSPFLSMPLIGIFLGFPPFEDGGVSEELFRLKPNDVSLNPSGEPTLYSSVLVEVEDRFLENLAKSNLRKRWR